MKIFLLSCMAAVVIVSTVGCSSDRECREDTCQSASYDTKDMHPRHHHHSDQQ